MICLELSERPFLLKDHWLSNQLYINNASNASNLTYKILFQGVTLLEKKFTCIYSTFIEYLLYVKYCSGHWRYSSQEGGPSQYGLQDTMTKEVIRFNSLLR